MTLTPERWQRARDVLHEALQMDEEERSGFLDSQCASDPSLRVELKELLAAEGELEPSFLEKPAVVQAAVHTDTSERGAVLRPGTKLGAYVVQSLIGAGGMGEVYRARDASLKRDVAIKVLPASLSRDPDRLRRFQLEAEAAAALNHANILSIFHIGQQDGSPYIVTELLEGETLRERLRHGALKLRDGVDIAIQAAKGLAAAHEKGIAHRDLKPENLFLTKDGRVKILDFGLAKLMRASSGSDGPTVSLRDQTDAGRVLGTVGYMSPEQVRGEPADTRSDIFALGCVLYEMLTGKRAFRKPSSVETMNAILNEDPQAASDITRTIPPALERVVHRCLEKASDRRFQSASDLAFALDALGASGISSDDAKSRPRSTARPKRRAILLLTAATVLALAAGGAYIRWLSSGTPKVSNFVQLTHDGQPKSIIGLDGARIYLFLMGRGGGIAETHITGGQPTMLPILPPKATPMILSPDKSAFLINEVQDNTGTGPVWSLPVLGGSPRRLADVRANAGSWSPDGKKLAYSNGSAIVVANADGSDSRKITVIPDPAFVIAPIWSPDGSRIRFIVSKTMDIPSGFYFEVSPDGSGLHRLFKGWHDPPAWECCGAYTMDSKYFIFVSGDQLYAVSEHRGFLQPTPKPTQLTSSPIPLGGVFPTPDGKKFLLTGRIDHGELLRSDLATGKLLPFLGGISAEYLDFSKDGQWVAYVLYPEGTLWMSRLDGTERRQLSYPPMYAMVPRWSPDGTQIAFMDGALGKQQQIYTVAVQGGTPRLLLPGDKSHQSDPTWSADGNKILFSAGSNDPNAVIRVLDLSTNQLSTLPGSKGMFSSRWSPDGRFVVALTFDSTRLMLFDFQTHSWTELMRGSIGWQAWSSDSKYIYGMDYSGGFVILRVRLSDHKQEQVADFRTLNLTGFLGNWWGLAPDGSPLVLRNTGTADMYSLDWLAP